MNKKNNRNKISMNKKNNSKINLKTNNNTSYKIFIFIFMLFLLAILYISLESRLTITESCETNNDFLDEIKEKKQILSRYQMKKTLSLSPYYLMIIISILLLIALCLLAYTIITNNNLDFDWKNFLKAISLLVIFAFILNRNL